MTAREARHTLVHSTDGTATTQVTDLGVEPSGVANSVSPRSSGCRWKANPVCATRACPRASVPDRACSAAGAWSVNTGGHALNPSSISVFNGL